MIKVDENTVLEVGKFYLVKCAILNAGHVPVIGEEHTDKQFGVDYRHIHVDGRFKGRHPTYQINDKGQTNYVVDVTNSHLSYYHLIKYEYKKLKCQRLTTGINPPKTYKIYDDWYATYIGKSCKGKRCPHLGTKMHEVDGKLVCPLHNLTGCKTTEVIIPNQ